MMSTASSGSAVAGCTRAPFCTSPVAASGLSLREGLLALLLVLALLPAGCAEKQPQPIAPTTPSQVEEPASDDDVPPPAPQILDMSVFPQDLNAYAQRAGADRLLLTPETQAFHDQRYNRMFFSAWGQRRTTVPASEVFQPIRKDGKARGYAENLLPWDQTRWTALVANCNRGSYPSRADRAITVHNTSLRAMPTLRPRFGNPATAGNGFPFDYFQVTSLPAGFPVFVAHASRDGAWLYVETALTSGWVPAADVGIVDEAFVRAYQRGTYAAIINDDVAVTGPDGLSLGTVHVGAMLPLEGLYGDALRVFFPVREANGRAAMVPVTLFGADAAQKPLPITPGKVAEIGNRFMGQAYGWGGLHDDRDCSSTLRDLFTPFGVWLPRHSAAQAKMGRYVDFSRLSSEGKESRILAEATPFMTVLWLKGHITLYVGEWQGRAAMFHNAWGLRIQENGKDARFILGRALVTSTNPGAELPNRKPGSGLIDRMQGMGFVGEGK